MKQNHDKPWVWVYSKDGVRCLGYLYWPYGKRTKTDILESLGLINDCTYNPKETSIRYYKDNRI